MFNYIDPREERQTRIAQMAANLCHQQHYDPTDALYKVATDNALNRAETEDVCAKLNHILFQEKFAEDKLAVFNAAQYEKVTQAQGEIPKVAALDPNLYYRETLEKRAVEIAAMTPDQQVDPIMDEASDKFRNHEFSRFMEQAASNASEISAHHMAIDKIVGEMKQRILALYREGVPLEEVYNTVLMAVGESQAPAVQQYFLQVVQQLQAEGYIPADKKVYLNDPQKLAADYSAEPKLTKLAQELKMQTNVVLVKEALHELALDRLAELDRVDIADTIDKYVHANRFSAALEKMAADYTPVTPQVKEWNSIKEIIEANKDKLIGAGLLAGGIAATRGLVAGGQSGYRAIKRNILKRQLPKRYPELQQIRPELYSDLYDSITKLNPGLVKTPFVVSEAIKKFAPYETIDTGTALDLMNANSADPLLTDFITTPASDVLSNIGSTYLNYEAPDRIDIEEKTPRKAYRNRTNP